MTSALPNFVASLQTFTGVPFEDVVKELAVKSPALALARSAVVEYFVRGEHIATKSPILDWTGSKLVLSQFFFKGDRVVMNRNGMQGCIISQIHQTPGFKPRFDVKLESDQTVIFYKVKLKYLKGAEAEVPKTSITPPKMGGGGGGWSSGGFGTGFKTGKKSKSKLSRKKYASASASTANGPTEREASDKEDSDEDEDKTDGKKDSNSKDDASFSVDDIVDIKEEENTRFKRGIVKNKYPDGTFQIRFQDDGDEADHVKEEFLRKPAKRHIKHNQCDEVQAVLVDENDSTLAFVQKVLDVAEHADKRGFKAWKTKVATSLKKEGDESDAMSGPMMGGMMDRGPKFKNKLEELSAFFSQDSWEHAPEFTRYRDMIVLCKLVLEPTFRDLNST